MRLTKVIGIMAALMATAAPALAGFPNPAKLNAGANLTYDQTNQVLTGAIKGLGCVSVPMPTPGVFGSESNGSFDLTVAASCDGLASSTSTVSMIGTNQGSPFRGMQNQSGNFFNGCMSGNYAILQNPNDTTGNTWYLKMTGEQFKNCSY